MTELLVKTGQQVAMDETLGVVAQPASRTPRNGAPRNNAPRNSAPSALSPVSAPKTATQTVFRARACRNAVSPEHAARSGLFYLSLENGLRSCAAARTGSRL